MKRLILLMCAAGFIAPACTAEESYQQRAEAREAFAQAERHLDRAFAEDPGDEYRSIYEHRREQFGAAAQLLEPLTSSNEPADRVTAHSMLADASLSQGQVIIQQATANWSRQLPEQALLLERIGRLRSADVVRSEYEAVDFSSQISEVEAEIEDLLQEREQVVENIAGIEQTIDQINQQIEQTQQRRRELDARVDELSREAFQSEGEEQFELHREAGELSDQANVLAGQVEAAEGQRSVEQSQIELEQARISQLEEQVEELRAAVEALEERQAEVAETASAGAEEFDGLAQQLRELLQQVRTAHDEEIEQIAEQAHTHYETALNHLEQALQSARGQGRDAVHAQLQTARASYGRAWTEIAEARRAHRDLLADVADALEGVLPDEAQQLQAAAVELDEQSVEAADAAQALLLEADEELAGALDQPGLNEDRERSLLRSLVVVNSTLATVTRDPSYSDRAAGYREQLSNL